MIISHSQNVNRSKGQYNLPDLHLGPSVLLLMNKFEKMCWMSLASVAASLISVETPAGFK